MPELAEIALMCGEINGCSSHVFHSYHRSAVAKLGPDLPIPRCWTTFRLLARSRGKEMRVDISPADIDPDIRREEEKERQQTAAAAAADSSSSSLPSTPSKKRKTVKTAAGGGVANRVHPPSPVIPLDGPLPLLFRMGMTGHFQCFPDPEKTHKHAHLTFLSSSPSPLAVCFVDQRQFGRWLVQAEWDSTRGPCPLTEYALFRRHVLQAVREERRALAKPLCEVLLDQSMFNGCGNYLRAEICFRADVNPFQSALTVLQPLADAEKDGEEGEDEVKEEKKAGKAKGKGKGKEKGKGKGKEPQFAPDFLQLCHDLPHEVYEIGYRYGSEHNEAAAARAGSSLFTTASSSSSPPRTAGSRQSFSQWLRCYERHEDGMVSTVDNKGRAMWHKPAFSQRGKTKAGPRRPKKGKTISGANRVEAEAAQQQPAADEGEEGAEEQKEEKEEEAEENRVDEEAETKADSKKKSKGRTQKQASSSAKAKQTKSAARKKRKKTA